MASQVVTPDEVWEATWGFPHPRHWLNTKETPTPGKVARMADIEQIAERLGKQEGANVYARLMDFATTEPERELRSEVQKQTNAFAAKLTDQYAEAMRKAYTAGVADGYRDALVRGDDPEATDRRIAIISGLLTMVYADHPEDERANVAGLPELVAAAVKELQDAASRGSSRSGRNPQEGG